MSSKVDYLIGPVSVTKMSYSGKQIIILGDKHGDEQYKCSSSDNEQVSVDNFITDLVKGSDKFIDIFLELRQQVSKQDVLTFSEIEEKAEKGYLIKVGKAFQDCIYEKSKCPYSNIRVHYTDYRGIKEQHPLGHFSYNLIPEAIESYKGSETQDVFTQKLDQLFDYIDQVIIPILEHGLVLYYWKLISSLPKMGINSASKNIHDAIVGFITEIMKDIQPTFTKNVLELKNKISRIMRGEEGIRDLPSYARNIQYTFLKLNGILVDIYIFVRLFKTFKEPGKLQPSNINNAVIYVGYVHAINLKVMLESIGFKTVFNGFSENRCVKIGKMKQPWFSK